MVSPIYIQSWTRENILAANTLMTEDTRTLGAHMAEVKAPYLILGLDLGIGSCGFCLIDVANGRILEMGSHLFDIPQDPKSKSSLAATRRAARSVRRNTKRTRDRQKHCLQLLILHGLVPENATKEWLHSTKGDRPLLELRAKGLDNLLSDRQLAQVLYNLSVRRGYIPHGEGSNGEDADSKRILSAIKVNSERMEDLGCRTVGEMLYRQGSSRNSGGKYDKCVLHSQIVYEVKSIFAAQRALGNKKATPEFERDYLACLSWEKKSSSHDWDVYNRQVGWCSYFSDERRAARADLSSELCNAYERLCHITIAHDDGTKTKIPKQKIEEYLNTLFSPVKIRGNKDCKLTYKRIRNDLDISGRSYFVGINAEQEKDEPFVPRSWRAMRNGGLSEALLTRMRGERELADAIGESLTRASTEESLINELHELELTDTDIREITSLPFNGRNFNGYANRSLKALGILIDMFQESQITTLAQAEEASGLKERRLNLQKKRGTLLAPYDTYDVSCNNPVVLRALSRARKVVNAIIRIHGVPDEIHIEVANELKQTQREKARVAKRQQENKRNNERLAEEAAGILGVDASEIRHKILRKLSLLEEQGGFDVYTGDSISRERLVKDDAYAQIDHVLPYGRTCDDSRRNKVLVLAKSNQDKGDRTPYEWMVESGGSPDWDEYQSRILANPKLSYKRSHLLNTSLDSNAQSDFVNRNLNDTRYMSRAIKGWLEDTLMFPDSGKKVHVLAVSGGATAVLRRNWGLNYGAGNTKDRDDDRHHAVDAAVIAACSARSIRLVALAHSAVSKWARGTHESRLANTQPWESFAEDVIAQKELVVPTRMVSHKVTGRAFQETAYCFLGIDESKKGSFGLLRSGNRTSREGNYVVDKSGAGRLLDKMAFLRLWLNPDEPHLRGSSVGVWYAEPVYYADIPAVINGSHVPRYIQNGTARTAWKEVPSSARNHAPVTVFPDDVLVVDSSVARYNSIKIGNRHLMMKDIKSGNDYGNFPPIGSWNRETQVFVLEEDCLGHCYRDIFDDGGVSDHQSQL